MNFPDPVQMAVPLFIIAIILEMFAVRGGARGDYDWRDTGTAIVTTKA